MNHVECNKTSFEVAVESAGLCVQAVVAVDEVEFQAGFHSLDAA